METLYYNDTIEHACIEESGSTIGSAIAYNRKINHMTQQELAVKLNLNVTTIRRYETNKLIPSKKVYKKLKCLFPGFFPLAIPLKDFSYGAYLKQLRLLHNLTLQELSKLSGLSMRALSSYESNSRKPSSASLEKLKKVLKDGRDIL